jgi:IrrE N-terminal-like domain
MGPVMFVFDVSDTEPEFDAPTLPKEITHPFEVRGGSICPELELTIENAKRDGIRTAKRSAGSQSAGQIGVARTSAWLEVNTRLRPTPESIRVPVRYELLLNSEHSREAQYATLVHELAHLYCGHLDTPNSSWWPDRQGLQVDICEFEAESVCYLVCRRLGIDNPSEKYLAGYLVKNKDKDVPPISLECVMAASGLIERMGRVRLKPRKDGKTGT